MGAQYDEEACALLPRDKAPQKIVIPVASANDAPKTWKGSLLCCCAGCDPIGWGSCLFSYCCPCWAFGHNMKKALSLSVLSQAVVFFLLFFGGRALYLSGVKAAYDACPHEPSENGPKSPYHTHSGFENKDSTPMAGSLGASHTAQPEMTPECQKALGVMYALYALMLVLAIAGVIYAARRRNQIRKKFGIAGSYCGDCCAWLWCAPCALCQETRTMMSNNVHDGVWFGPTRLVSADPVISAPVVDEMEVDFKKPVNAKDFV